jgi:hypothetical protein
MTSAVTAMPNDSDVTHTKSSAATASRFQVSVQLLQLALALEIVDQASCSRSFFYPAY